MKKTDNDIIEEFNNKKTHYIVKLYREGKPEAYARERKGRGGFYNPKGDKMIEQRKEFLKSITKEEREKLKSIRESDKEYYIELELTYYIPIPKTDSKIKKFLKESGCILPTSRTGDLDNLDKFYLDTCHDILYDDDKRVVSISAKKFYSEKPRVYITANYTIIE